MIQEKEEWNMSDFEIENTAIVSAPTKWQARNEFEKLFDRKVFMFDVIRRNEEETLEDIPGILQTFF